MIAKRDVRTLVIVFAAILIALGVLWKCGVFGVRGDRVTADAQKSMEIARSWSAVEDGNAKQVTGIFYDYDQAPLKGICYCYVNRPGVSCGFFFRQSCKLDRDMGIRKLDLGQYGAAYVSLNSQQVAKAIRDDGTKPVTKSVSPYSPFVIVSEKRDCAFHFYDEGGREVPVSGAEAVVRD